MALSQERQATEVNDLNDISLSALRPGQRGIVRALAAPDHLSRRLQDMGLIPGTAVDCLARSPLGDPCAYQIRGAVVALRREDASLVRVAV